MIRRKNPVTMLLLCSVLLAAGCSRSPRINFYTLTATAAADVATPQPSVASISIDAVTLPEFVDRPQFVIVEGDNRVNILELHQWAESLKSALPRILADNLSRQLGADRVSAYPQRAGSSADYHVAVDFQRFEATAAAVSIDALWSVSSVEKKLFSGRTKVRETRKDGYDSVASAYSMALAVVSADIARSIRKELPQ